MTESTTPIAAYTAVLTQEARMTGLANSSLKFCRPSNRAGGSSGVTRKNACTVVAIVG